MIALLTGLILSAGATTEPWVTVRASCEVRAHLEITLSNHSTQELLIPNNRIPWAQAGDLFHFVVVGEHALRGHYGEVFGINSSEIPTRLAPGRTVQGTISLQPYFGLPKGTPIEAELQLQWSYSTDAAPVGYPTEMQGRVTVPKGCRL